MHVLKKPLIAGICSILVLAIYSVWGSSTPLSREGKLVVTFLDVGQGDSILIESPTGTQVLIDGGKGSVVLSELAEKLGFFDRHIDTLVATHPDMDHIGGLIHVLDRYTIDTILITENESDTPAFASFMEKVDLEGADILYARRGQIYDLGVGEMGSTTFTILFPDRNPIDWESNTASIVGQLVYGSNEFLLTGDAPEEIEEYLVHTQEDLRSDVLKAGHHGSRTSSSALFIEAVQPQYAVVSAGRDNSYGHPHAEVVDRFLSYGVSLQDTRVSGSITFVSDGYAIDLAD